MTESQVRCSARKTGHPSIGTYGEMIKRRLMRWPILESQAHSQAPPKERKNAFGIYLVTGVFQGYV